MKLLFEASAPVDADPRDVERLIDDEWVLRQFLGGGESSGTASHASDSVDIDHQPGMIGFQGHWWYRGEIRVTGDPTTLHYRVFNIARRGAWAVPLANRMFVGYAATVQAGVDGLARAIEHHLAAGSPEPD